MDETERRIHRIDHDPAHLVPGCGMCIPRCVVGSHEIAGTWTTRSDGKIICTRHHMP